MSNINSTKEERQKVYGDYKGGVDLRGKMVRLILERHKEVNGSKMTSIHAEAIWDIINKLSRIAVTPDHVDSWHDVSVYANLTEEMIKENSNANK